ncbi:outer membrane protein assembly factor BamB [Enterovibrio norvegicus]|uniref:Outer membrane protein assembly factor BamB n=1 Tax=Enterovibrio norvegicus TaxID=188144 RepID=A0A2N7LHR0_9GAMM|nr:outer membrane protein assembly factor BamB [Enterovibrio norvegicus]MCC4799913.1 outer membrane protein assembly factor BamB [Enterovibrio norvegicus]OEF52864.1 outer membrane protein assembly factor BamB [Enterovibrio norvegicus]OEF54960.1 outer membrane protein assembly factor BamB [Enterovibrio norvegicus]PMH61887.1 outer membrane protein assembly factor BamB [Enterovibrio norvegicus]PMI33319.1 outer membrane protein assembly factor BamB [Enterovibrio norvegicus]
MMRKGWKHVGAVALLGALLAGCASEEDSIQMAPLPVVQSEFTPAQLWSSQVGDGVGRYFSNLSPAVAYDKVYAADRDGIVSAMDLESGKTVWSVNLGEEAPALLSGGITASYSKLYIGTETGELIALDEETGELVWRTQVGGEILSKPLADEGLIVVNSSRGEISAYEAETGEQRWSLSSEVPNLTLRGDSSPVSISGGVFWGMANGRLGAAFIENGNIIWQQTIASPKGATEIDRLVDVDSTPVVAGSLLYAVGYNGSLVAIDLRSGRPAWKRTYSSSTDIMVAGSYLFLITDKDHVVAVDARSGTELWTNKELEYRQLTAPVAISGYVVVGDAEGYLHWIDPTSGEFVAQQQLDDSGIAVAPMNVDDGYIVVTRDGSISKKQTP